MTAPTELLQVLETARRACQSQAGDTRALAAKDAAARFAALLDEIEQSVLPRTLSFAIGDACRLSVETGDRRLRGISEVVPDTLRDPAFKLLPDLGGGPRSKRIETLKSVLLRFTEATGEMTVRSSPPVHLKGSGFNGFATYEFDDGRAPPAAAEPAAPPEPEPQTAPASAAPEAAKAPVKPAAPPSAEGEAAIPDTLPGAFFQATSAFALSRVVTTADGALAGKAGDDRQLPLEFLLRAFSAQIEMNAPFMDVVMPGPKAIIMGTQAADMPSVCCLIDESGLAIATVDNSALGAVIATAAAAIAASQEA